MSEPREAPYGSWRSPVTTDLVFSSTIGLEQAALDGEDVYWTESHPAEAGRSVLMRRGASGQVEQITPAFDAALGRNNFNVRTRVHEYGGGAFVVWQGAVFFSNFSDQRVYRRAAGLGPIAITPAGLDLRFADYQVDAQRSRLLCVREDHRSPYAQPENTIVALAWSNGAAGVEDGSAANSGQVLVSGNDFYASPRLSPDGRRLAWLTWNHPNMPWDGNELWVADIGDDGVPVNARQVAGGSHESVFQPAWSPAGTLWFVSDRTGWWNLYRLRFPAEAVYDEPGVSPGMQSSGSGQVDRSSVLQRGIVEPIYPMEAEFGSPQWQFGMSNYAFVSTERVVCVYQQGGRGHLAMLDGDLKRMRPVSTGYTTFSSVRATGDRVYCLAGSPTEPNAFLEIQLPQDAGQKGTASGGTSAEEVRVTVVRRSSSASIDPGYVSVPESVDFPTTGGQTAHGFFYQPRNQDYVGNPGDLPPLIVISHGGPTGFSSALLSLALQYWTSRGFAVLDVNYGGSTGYGREYRERLKGQWGIVDVDDCINGALDLAGRGRVDGRRLAIRGGSAGGYTTLAALTFRDVFQAGASYYGVSDLEALAKETHKFESHYLDGLIGAYPVQKDRYMELSPINHLESLSTPVIFFQGLDDKVVPPNQAEGMFDAVRQRGLPTAYVAFEGEGHGFRRRENLKRAQEAEFYFYSRIFGFTPADAIEPVQIENLTA